MPRLSKIGAAALAAFGWTSGAAGVTANYLIVAGGGSGANAIGGGGGAGGLLSGSTTLNPSLSYTIIVGAGGAGSPAANAYINGNSGANSSALGFTAIGGGYGGTYLNAGGNGGSGGGGGTDNSAGGTGTAGQGNAGGASNNAYPQQSGGGGGAGAAGANATNSNAGNGGAGAASSISGSSVTYAGGGGGSFNADSTGAVGSGGAGGGTAGGNQARSDNATPNTGGGSGGGGYRSIGSPANFSRGSGNGGSGIVIISYAGAQQFGGGVVTSVGGNTIHTFTTSGTLSPLSSLTASYLIVAGGGGGGATNGGGGGGGGMLTGSGLTIDTNSVYVVTVGAGGAGAATGVNNGVQGGNSSFSIVSTSAVGGGRGAGSLGNAGGNGGSGGGGSAASGVNYSGGSATSGQGFAGGTSGTDGATYNGSGGGGGAGGAGQNGSNTNSRGGAGGVGATSSISGASVTYAGGGGGGANGDVSTPSPQGTGGAGGAGGGGNGATGLGYLTTNNSPSGTGGTAGTANLGGGGGGGGSNGLGSSFFGFSGGSGIVIISYPGSTPQMAGGTVTAAGGNIIHTFTSSGYLTPITNLNNSLRFRKSASAFLNRTPTVAGNRQRFTWSAWVKGFFGNSTVNSLFGAGNGNSVGNQNAVMYTFAGNIGFGSGVFGVSTDATFTTNAVYRDPAAWYHIVFAVDTTQATDTNRMILYVNGVQQTFSSVQYPSQNYSFPYNATLPQKIGESGGGSETFDGYMTEINFIDGQALTPSSFGAFNGQGVWQPVRYGGSYGTNGFYLPFNATSSYYSYLFNQTPSYLSTTSANTLPSGNTTWSVECWTWWNQAPTANWSFIVNQNIGGLQLLYQSSSSKFDIGAYGVADVLLSSVVSTSLLVNQWNHICYTSDGSNLRIFLNGVMIGYTASSYSFASQTTVYIGSNDGGTTSTVNGYISNLRVCNGSIPTSYQTSSTTTGTKVFTPPTSPLTTSSQGASNVSVLTCQSSTIVDNSPTPKSLTNVGTVVPRTFAFDVNPFNDQSPAGNNWTANNISLAYGSTYDSMTDVPTNTSATVANYCVLNVLGASQPVTVSNANLTVSCGNGSAYGNIIGSMAIPSSGKYYFEAICTQNAAQATWGLQSNPGSGTNRFEWYSGTIYYGGTSTSGATYATNDVLALAIDVDGGVIYTYKNGALQNTVSYNISALTLFPYFGTGFINTIVNFNTNFGQQPFAYTPPAGFVALNTFNLPTPTIGATPATTANKYFDATLYTGTGTTNNVTNSGSMQPDFVWIKNRSSTNSHQLTDSVRGINNALASDLTIAEYTGNMNAFNTNGFQVTSSSNSVNNSGQTYVGWQWRASNTTAVTNTAGSITSSVSANTTAGFSIVSYTTQSSGTGTVGHGLGVAPSMIILKNRALNNNWIVYHTSLGASVYLYLNTNASTISDPSVFNGTNPTSTVFSMGTGLAGSISTIAYCFAQVAGYSAFGSYTGNGNANGPFVYTGFRPRYLMIKRTDSAGGWFLVDTARNPYNIANLDLFANTSDAEAVSNNIDILSNGFRPTDTNTGTNANGGSFIYMAFAESPFKYANAR